MNERLRPSCWMPLLIVLVVSTPGASALSPAEERTQEDLLRRTTAVGPEAYFTDVPSMRTLVSLLSADLQDSLSADELTQDARMVTVVEAQMLAWQQVTAPSTGAREDAQRFVAGVAGATSACSTGVDSLSPDARAALVVVGCERILNLRVLQVVGPLADELAFTRDQVAVLDAAIAAAGSDPAVGPLAARRDRLAASLERHSEATDAALATAGRVLAAAPDSMQAYFVFADAATAHKDLVRLAGLLEADGEMERADGARMQAASVEVWMKEAKAAMAPTLAMLAAAVLAVGLYLALRQRQYRRLCNVAATGDALATGA